MVVELISLTVAQLPELQTYFVGSHLKKKKKTLARTHFCGFLIYRHNSDTFPIVITPSVSVKRMLNKTLLIHLAALKQLTRNGKKFQTFENLH